MNDAEFGERLALAKAQLDEAGNVGANLLKQGVSPKIMLETLLSADTLRALSIDQLRMMVVALFTLHSMEMFIQDSAEGLDSYDK